MWLLSCFGQTYDSNISLLPVLVQTLGEGPDFGDTNTGLNLPCRQP